MYISPESPFDISACFQMHASVKCTTVNGNPFFELPARVKEAGATVARPCAPAKAESRSSRNR